MSPGPRLKPTIETAGDIAYGRRRAQLLGAELRRRLEAWEADQARARAVALPRVDEQLEHQVVNVARAWIRDHGGSITAALKETHPDHGGTSVDFQKTMWARAILRKKRAQRPT